MLRATIDFASFNDLVTNIRIGKTGFAFILNREGEFQTKPLLDIVPSKDMYGDFIKNTGKTKDEVHVIERKDDFKKKNLYVSAFLKDGD